MILGFGGGEDGRESDSDAGFRFSVLSDWRSRKFHDYSGVDLGAVGVLFFLWVGMEMGFCGRLGK